MLVQPVPPSGLPKRFGWVGLIDPLGFSMAFHLRQKLPKDTALIVYDIDPYICEKFVRETTSAGGVKVAKNAREVTENSDCLISLVPEGSHVKEVYLTPETGALATDTSGKLFIDCSTIDITTSLLICHAVKDSSSSARFFDAPVLGGTLNASSGTVTFMVGSSPSDPHFPLLHDIFSLMSTKVHALGGPSLGLAAKLSNNYLSGLIALGTSEAMNLGMRLGIDPHVLSACFRTSSGGSYINDNANPAPGVCPDSVASRGYQGGFTEVQLMKRDISLAIKVAEEVGAKMVLAEPGLKAYTAASEDPRCREKDYTVVYRWLGGVEPEVQQSPEQ
ncbi:hypothetical protein D9758_005891 [Tetrapyrgos nigripes]|uniref:3-hydroxyisobutyrate dehydrogenase n=1 Tax=Tetrapyrgos nigripes TaxID=182062 RepID=A0A8H5LHH4_9AGAR|nr:hypothetical protein D9758_005891 [Tetrapyrgos nigripes]